MNVGVWYSYSYLITFYHYILIVYLHQWHMYHMAYGPRLKIVYPTPWFRTSFSPWKCLVVWPRIDHSVPHHVLQQGSIQGHRIIPWHQPKRGRPSPALLCPNWYGGKPHKSTKLYQIDLFGGRNCTIIHILSHSILSSLWSSNMALKNHRKYLGFYHL